MKIFVNKLCILLLSLLLLTTCNNSLAGLLELQRKMVPVTSAEALQAAISNAKPGAVIGVVADITLSGALVIGNGDTITITAFDRDVTIKSTHTSQPLFNVAPGGALTLGGSSLVGNLVLDGKIAGNFSRINSLISVGSGPGSPASCTMNDGVIIQNNSHTGISIDFEFGGGAVAVHEDGVFIMNGGTIRDNGVAHKGGGVYVGGNGSFIMKNGTIYNNNASMTGGGGVFIEENGTFVMSGGIITHNSSMNNTGGGVYIVDNGSFIFEGGTITHNVAKKNGGGVVLSDNSTFTMNGGTIAENQAESGIGGGIYAKSNVDMFFIMNGGEIINNKTGTPSNSATSTLYFYNNSSTPVQFNILGNQKFLTNDEEYLCGGNVPPAP